MKNLLKCLATLFLIAVSSPAFADPTGCDDGEEELKFSLVTAVEGNPKGESALAFARLINAEMEGRYCVKVYGRSELFSDPKVFDAILRGEVHFAAPNLQRFGNLSPKFALFDLPFLFDGPIQAEAFLNSGAREELSKEVEDDGFVLMGVWSAGMRHFTANRPMRSASDAKGMKLRFANKSPIIQRIGLLLEADVDTGPFRRLYEQLEAREFDGQENTFSNIFAMDFMNVQSAVTQTSHWYLGFGAIASKAFLDSLDSETRKFFEDSMEIVSHESNRFSFEIDAIRRQDILDFDGVIIQLAPEELETWRNTLAPITEEFKDQIGREFVDTAIRINAETDPFD